MTDMLLRERVDTTLAVGEALGALRGHVEAVRIQLGPLVELPAQHARLEGRVISLEDHRTQQAAITAEHRRGQYSLAQVLIAQLGAVAVAAIGAWATWGQP